MTSCREGSPQLVGTTKKCVPSKQNGGRGSVWMPSTYLALTRVFWRRFASFRGLIFGVPAGRGHHRGAVRFPAAPLCRYLVVPTRTRSPQRVRWAYWGSNALSSTDTKPGLTIGLVARSCRQGMLRRAPREYERHEASATSVCALRRVSLRGYFDRVLPRRRLLRRSSRH